METILVSPKFQEDLFILKRMAKFNTYTFKDNNEKKKHTKIKVSLWLTC